MTGPVATLGPVIPPPDKRLVSLKDAIGKGPEPGLSAAYDLVRGTRTHLPGRQPWTNELPLEHPADNRPRRYVPAFGRFEVGHRPIVQVRGNESDDSLHDEPAAGSIEGGPPVGCVESADCADRTIRNNDDALCTHVTNALVFDYDMMRRICGHFDNSPKSSDSSDRNSQPRWLCTHPIAMNRKRTGGS